MKITSIEQVPIDGTDAILTTVEIQQVTSQCILTRLLIQALGRPGVDNDMEFMGSGDSWTILWTEPQLSIEATHLLISRAIA